MTSSDQHNIIAECLNDELHWLENVLSTRIKHYFEQGELNINSLSPPNLENTQSEYAQLITKYKMDFNERFILILALSPSIRPQALDTLLIKNINLNKRYSEFGGWESKFHKGFLPTCETAVFLLSENDIEKRFIVQKIFEEEHFFTQKGILKISSTQEEDTFLSRPLGISTEYFKLVTKIPNV